MMNVQNNKFKLLLAAGAVSMALTGCGGSDGSDGNPGNPGGPAADAIEVLHLDVTKVEYDNGTPTITVFATNQEDLPVIGLKDLEVKKVVQLLPQDATGAGNAAEWQYIGSQKAFTDHKNGNYTFTIDVEGYNPELTQRYNIVAKASTLLDGVTLVPQTEIAEDFSGEGYEPLYTKNVVSTASCNSCHAEGQKIYHSYTSVETCVSCHTQEMADEKGKPQVAFNHLIHNVHNDAKMYGRNMDKSAETAHHIVQDNCQACHVKSDELTEWGNWSRIPTMETCTSCHVNIDFEAGKGHSQQNDNSNCVACHNASWTAELHTQAGNDKKALIDQYGLNVESTINTEGTAATISVQVVDASGAAVDINTILPMVQRFEIVTNVGPNNVTLGYGGKDSINAVKNGVVDAAAMIEDGKLVYTTSKDLKLGANGIDSETAFTFVGWAMCSDKGEFVTCDDPAFDGSDTDKYTGMKADLAFAALADKAPSMRHVDSVNFTACASCHTTEFEVHKGSHHAGFVLSEQLSHAKDANDMPIIGVDACVACHTPDGTYAGGANKGALEMKLHVVHGEQGIIKDCAQCHNDFNLDAFKAKGALATAAGQYSTPIAATCTSCHTSDSVKAHAESQGAIINGAKDVANDAAQLETCFFCHAPVIEDHTAVKM
ncbi:OmcA/MtrC family decaheme c-type cytochrome [Shewanella alkalitolerans]|uniref:OmcA/MtrC family decaheme c-type cytochrome n=1 Tax=Shewanella alkalitolerans TaxID=2864209 RepID=UPI001C656BB3|nr:OmcA/MtrC family decaheme c-type cytochrome [Shewanella alkalitolerans]QYJ96456.1 OmcA/MtrC family decaheme c-type cytochrome [Shewanella alkalitolerans]